MPTVIDALTLELNLDSTNLKDGAKLTIEVLNKTKNEAVKSGKTIEDASQKAANSIVKITSAVLGLYAALVGARSIKDFAADLTTANAALGRFASNMNEAPQQIAAWSMAAQRFGGSGEGVAATFDRIGRSLFELKQNGQLLPKEFSQLQAWAGMRIDTDKGVNKFLTDTSAAIKRLNEIDPSRVKFIADGMGIDAGTLEVMKQYGAEVGAYLDTLKKNAPSDQAIKSAQKLQEQWAALQQTATGLAQAVMTSLSPEIEKLLKQMAAWVEANQEWLRTEIVTVVKNFADYLKQVDWQAVGQGLSDFAEGAREVTTAIGGIEKATIALIALWAGSKALGMLSALKDLTTKKTITQPSGGMNILGALGVWGGAIAGAYSLTEPTPDLQKQHGFNFGVDDVIKKIFSAEGEEGVSWKGIKEFLLGDASKEGFSFRNSMAIDTPKSEGEVSSGGRPVSKSNPLPVEIKEKPSEPGWLDNLLGGAKRMFDFSASAGTLPAGGGDARRSADFDPTGSARTRDAKPFKTGDPVATDLPAHAKAFLNATAGGESGGAYNIRYTPRGGKHFELNGEHPRIFEPGPHGKSSAAGRYQFTATTWDSMGGGEFTPENQDRKAWALAQKDYKARTGRDLDGDLQKYGMTDSIQSVLTPTWQAFKGQRGRHRATYEQSLARYKSGDPGGYRDPMVSAPNGVITGAAGSAMANNVNNSNSTTNSNSVSASIGTVNVNAPNATDAKGVAGGMLDGLRTTIPALSNYGPR